MELGVWGRDGEREIGQQEALVQQEGMAGQTRRIGGYSPNNV